MSHWHPKLCNKPHDILIDSFVLLIIPLAFLPQIHRLYTVPTMSGISAHYLLFNVILSSTQLSWELTNAAYGEAPRSFTRDIASGRLTGWRAFGASLGLMQLTMQWLCSVLQLILHLIGSSAGGPNGYSFLAAATLHAAIILIPTVKITLPGPSKGEWGLGFVLAFLNFTSIITMPICLVLQFLAQLGELRGRDTDVDAVSLLSWCLQIPVLALIAFRWACRSGLPPWIPSERYGSHIWLLLWDSALYYYVSCTVAINFVVWASEMYLLVAYYLWTNWAGTVRGIGISGP